MIKSTNPQEEEIKDVDITQNTGVVDINIASIKKQKFRINGDNNKILELNTSDLGIVTRLSELYPKLQELADKAAQIGLEDESTDDETEEDVKAQLDKLAVQFKEIDAGMREYLDELFQANVSEMCAPFGNMYDIVNGQFRYDNIIDTLADLYNQNISKEAKALRDRLAKKTEKYTSQDHKKSTKRGRSK